MTIELCRLADGKVSVRLDGTELYILPNKMECGTDDIQNAMQELVNNIVGEDSAVSR